MTQHHSISPKRHWGGLVKPRTRISDKGKICHGNTWRISHNETISFINDIQPYMLIPYKIQQIQNCVTQSNIPNNRRYKCNYCINDYASPSGRRRHEKNDHSDKLEESIEN